jgi:hypothetical protein
MRWVFTGSEDGYIRKYDFFASMNGKTLLTQGQRHGQVDSVTKVTTSYNVVDWSGGQDAFDMEKSQLITHPSFSHIGRH